MRKSKYNYHFTDGNKIIMYNARTNALVRMDESDFKNYENYALNNQNEIEEELKQSLKYGGYIVEDDANELDMIRYQVYASRFSSNIMNLTIAPTSDCNFRCPYCYERNVLRPGRMKDETQVDILNFIESQIGHLDSLNITWYGGEPLLELERILSLSKQILKLCAKNNVRYFSSIITNGYLLDLEILKKLMSVQIRHIQITIDGPKEYHDKRRYLVGKKPTFDRIMNNLLSFQEICQTDNFPLISVRMNLDKNNIDGYEKLKNRMAEKPLNKYVYFYVASVYDKCDTNHRYTFTPEEFNKIEKEKQENIKQLYPETIGAHCVCDSLNGFVIDSDGSLYKCWEEMGNKELCIGNIHDLDTNGKPAFYYDYLLFDPSKNEKCAQCEILPVCMGGGCPNRILRDEYQPNCKDIISRTYKNIKAYYHLMNEQRKEEC